MHPPPIRTDFEEVIWLIGDGRSGTTWLSELIARSGEYRTMFEPFHPQQVQGMSSLWPPRYLRPSDPEASIYRLALEVFSGRLRHPWVDAQGYRSAAVKLLIKDIFANLFACWAARRFQGLRIILMIRHPFAVAWSKSRHRDWFWMKKPTDFLRQPKLLADFLRPFEDLILNVGDDFIERQVLIWAVLHHVPLAQFRADQIQVVFYEDLARDTNQELGRLFGRRFDLSREILQRPSRVTDSQRDFSTGPATGGGWRRGLTSRQVDRGLRILSLFGLERLYGEGVEPDHRVVESLLARSVTGLNG